MNKYLSQLARWLKQGSCLVGFIALSTTTINATPISPPSPPYVPNELEIAVEKNDLVEVRETLKIGANIEGKNDEGYPLQLAIMKGDYKMAELLLNHGAKVEQKENSFSPLHAAARNSRSNKEGIEIIKLLLSKGANVNHIFNDFHPTITINGTTPIFWTVGNPEATELLIRAGADINIKTTSGNSLLYFAVQARDIVSVKRLLDLGINIDKNEPILHMIALDNYEAMYREPFSKQEAMVLLLLKAGYDINSQERRGGTSLHKVITRLSLRPDIKLLKLWLEQGADPNLFDANLFTKLFNTNQNRGVAAVHRFASNIYPFMESQEPFNIEVFQLLINYGANINALTKRDPQTILDILYQEALNSAERHNYDINQFEELALIKYLRSKGAKFKSELEN